MAQKYYKNTIMTIVTVAVAALAAVGVFFLILTVTSDKGESSQGTQGGSSYSPTPELATEMKIQATDLIKKNHEILTLFYTKGISYEEEPYGAYPSDGYFTGADETYTKYSQVVELVESVYVKETAEKVIEDPLGNGPTLGDDGNDVLGLSSSFKPMEYDRSWENVSFSIAPVSDTECDIEITIKESDGSPVELEATMLLQDGKWLLEDVIS